MFIKEITWQISVCVFVHCASSVCFTSLIKTVYNIRLISCNICSSHSGNSAFLKHRTKFTNWQPRNKMNKNNQIHQSIIYTTNPDSESCMRCWSLSQLSLGERQSTPWISHTEKHSHSHTHLELPINQTCMSMDFEEAEIQGELTQAKGEQSPHRRDPAIWSFSVFFKKMR